MGRRKKGQPIPTWNKDNIRELLRTNHRAVLKAVVVIYGFQTEEEIASNETFEHNGKGYGVVDARFMGRMAKKILRKEKLTELELFTCRNKIAKYAQQLANVANSKEELKSNVQAKYTEGCKENKKETAYNDNVSGVPGCSYGICNECQCLHKGEGCSVTGGHPGNNECSSEAYEHKYRAHIKARNHIEVPTGHKANNIEVCTGGGNDSQLIGQLSLLG